MNTGLVGFDAWGNGPAVNTVPADITFRTCYISHDENKMCTPAYVREWLVSGRHIIFNFEDTANVLGRDGKADALYAQQIIRDRYGFIHVPCIWSCDADVQPPLIDLYSHGWSEVFTPELTGPYGSAAVINYCVVNGISALGWESMSHGWRGGFDPTHAQIVQEGPGTIGGVTIDWDHIVQNPGAVEADVPHTPPAPEPTPVPQPTNTPGWRAHHNPFTPVAVDHIMGPLTWKAVQYVVLGGLPDGIPGRITMEGLQRYLGVTVDGRFGFVSTEALQRRLGDVSVDGGWGPQTTGSLQAHLNAGTF